MSNANHSPALALIQQLQQRIEGTRPAAGPLTAGVPVRNYICPERFAREQQLFRYLPLILGHESQLSKPGDVLVQDWLDLPLITIRDEAGEIATFMNVCRHRGMRLVQGEGKTELRSLVCPYHRWTYGLDGALRNIPLQESFGNLDPADLGLVRLPTEVRHGMIWVLATLDAEMNLEDHLQGLGADLETFGCGELKLGRQHVREIHCNWKLIQDAFLDGYHVTRLHKNTVGGFFPDSLVETDCIGRHIRSAVARNEIFETVGLPPEQLNLRTHATFSYSVFPNAVLIMHPEYTSIISLYPKAPDRTIFAHSMLSPDPIETEDQREHFQHSFQLIDQGVFQGEDIYVSEGIQRGLDSGTNEQLTFGGFESAAVKFHELLEEALLSGL